jgi:uncharacterized protein
LILLDASLLVYAYDARSLHHAQAKQWLNDQLNAGTRIGIPWISAWAFIRIATNPRIQQEALSAGEALEILAELRESPFVVMVDPGRRHAELLLQQMLSAQIRGPETTDAVLAAMAIELGAQLASTDMGFRRFVDLQWVNPLAELQKKKK